MSVLPIVIRCMMSSTEEVREESAKAALLLVGIIFLRVPAESLGDRTVFPAMRPPDNKGGT